MKHFLIFLGIVVASCILYSCTVSSDRADISTWVVARGEKVKDIDSRTLNIGPYWYMKNARYYRVETDKHVYWFKFLWGHTIKMEVGNGYETIED